MVIILRQINRYDGSDGASKLINSRRNLEHAADAIEVLHDVYAFKDGYDAPEQLVDDASVGVVQHSVVGMIADVTHSLSAL